MAVEGGLEAPTRHPIAWKAEEFWDEAACEAEMERVFDICHGCRRCLSLCNSFPTLFDLIDESETMEVDGVDKSDYVKVADQCFMCDLCFQVKCPYVPPHPFNLDFPALMLQAKAQKFKRGEASTRDKVLAKTDAIGKLTRIPLVDVTFNAVAKTKPLRKALQAVAGIHAEAPLPKYRRAKSSRAVARVKDKAPPTGTQLAEPTRGAVAIFSTCYGRYNDDSAVTDIATVFEHNGIPTRRVYSEQCCGMPSLELGDLQSVERAMLGNVPQLAKLVELGWDIVTPVPSCTLMLRKEYPKLFASDEQVHLVSKAIFDPMEYLHHRNKAGLLKTQFSTELGTVLWHVACHQRVQNVGPVTRQVLELIQGTKIEMVERCSGHDGTYAVRAESREYAVKLGRPAARKIDEIQPDHVAADCPLAGSHIAELSSGNVVAKHPLSLLRMAYGI